MTSNRHRRPSMLTRILLVLALPFAVLAFSVAAGATSANEHITLSSVTINGVDHGLRAVARGAVSGTGTFQGRDAGSASQDLIKLTFPKGSVTISGHETSTRMTPNMRACTAEGVGRGTFTVVSGTGAYMGATGGGTYVRRTSIVGARSSSGACLAQKAQPKLIRYRATLVANIALP